MAAAGNAPTTEVRESRPITALKATKNKVSLAGLSARKVIKDSALIAALNAQTIFTMVFSTVESPPLSPEKEATRQKRIARR
jgi:hypothetical protein